MILGLALVRIRASTSADRYYNPRVFEYRKRTSGKRRGDCHIITDWKWKHNDWLSIHPYPYTTLPSSWCKLPQRLIYAPSTVLNVCRQRWMVLSNKCWFRGWSPTEPQSPQRSLGCPISEGAYWDCATGERKRKTANCKDLQSLLWQVQGVWGDFHRRLFQESEVCYCHLRL